MLTTLTSLAAVIAPSDPFLRLSRALSPACSRRPFATGENNPTLDPDQTPLACARQLKSTRAQNLCECRLGASFADSPRWCAMRPRADDELCVQALASMPRAENRALLGGDS